MLTMLSLRVTGLDLGSLSLPSRLGKLTLTSFDDRAVVGMGSNVGSPAGRESAGWSAPRLGSAMVGLGGRNATIFSSSPQCSALCKMATDIVGRGCVHEKVQWEDTEGES